MLRIEDLRVGYGGALVLLGVSLEVAAGEVAALLGPNGAGKTTLARTLLGRLKPSGGAVYLADERVTGLPTHVLIRRGLALVPEGRMVIKVLSTEDNLRLGGIARTLKGAGAADLEFVYEQFPRLRERRNVAAGLLSGGEQQMLAIGRALTMHPRVLILDEPSLGLAPMIVSGLFAAIRRLADRGTAVLVAEQNVRAALEIADSAHVLANGRITRSGPASDFTNSSELVELYLGKKEAASARQRQPPSGGPSPAETGQKEDQVSRQVVSTDLAGRGQIPSSQAVIVGNLVFTAGTGALEPGTHEIKATSFGDQVRRTIENISSILQAAGTSLEHCAKVECFIRRQTDFEEYNRIYREYFAEPYPPRMTFIADLVRPDADIEMSAIAVIPDGGNANGAAQ